MKDIIESLENKLETQNVRLRRYYEYYKGNHDILKEYEPSNRAKNKAEVHNFCRMIIENNVGYLLGIDPHISYEELTNGEDNIVDDYNEILGSYIAQVDSNIMKFQQIFGFTFELNYINKDGEFRVSAISPLDMAVIRDGKKVVYGLYRRKITDNYTEYDLFDVLHKNIYRIQKNKDDYEIVKQMKNVLDNPIIYIKNNHEELSELKDIISLNDAYNLVATDGTAEISQHRNSYLNISGAKIDEETLAQANELGVFASPNEVKIDFITKKLDSSFIENKLDTLKKQIYAISGNVDFNDTSIGSSTSSLALRNKLTTLNNKLSTIEDFLVEGIMMRFKNLEQHIKTTHISPKVNPVFYDHTKVRVQFIKNVPTSGYETAQQISLLYSAGLLSKETAISLTGLVSDAVVEMDRIEKENENNIDMDIAQLMNSKVE